MGVLLRTHGDLIVETLARGEDAGLKSDLEHLLGTQKTETSRVLDLVDRALGTMSFVRDTL